MNGHRINFNSHALNAINKAVQIPDAKLGVGSGEDLTPQPQMVFYPVVMKPPVMPDMTSISYERTTIDGYAEPVKESDFPKELFIGDAIGGI